MVLQICPHNLVVNEKIFFYHFAVAHKRKPLNGVWPIEGSKFDRQWPILQRKLPKFR